MVAESPECLDEQTLAEFVAGQLSAPDLQRVESHLARCSDCRSAVADAVQGVNGPARPTTDYQQSGIPQVGDLLAGKYRIEGAIGRGGMGLVLAARHVELGHRVAIKILDSRDPSAGARFLREAKTSAQLINDHIVRVFDFGRLRSGVPYFVMEHLLGEDLQARIARGSVPIPLAVEYVLQTCAALREAHAAGVIHRDLKPSNLFIVARSDGQAWLKVLDFGLSKLVQAPDGRTAHPTLTQSESVLGSPLYMSPEQIRSSKTIDARSDIWSLGVILYELLTRQRPFNGPSLAAVLVAISTEPFVPPSALVPELPSELEAIVLRCLKKEPEARFADIDALVEALRPFARPLVQVASAPPPRGARAGARHWGLFAVPLLCLGACVVWALGMKRQITPEPPGVVPRPQSTAAAAPAAQVVLRVRCDRPLPAGNVRWFAATPSAAAAPSWPVARVCEAESSPERQRELIAALRAGDVSYAAALEPGHLFYAIDWKQELEQWSLVLARAPRASVALQLSGVACDAIDSVRVLAVGASSPLAMAPRGSLKNACRRSVELPFEAFGKTLAFELEPAGYTATPVAFSGDLLAVPVTRATTPKRKPPPVEPARRCLPPDEFCRE